jgi:hypothetical protein
LPLPLSYLDYVAFIADVKPDSLSLPDWGGIAQWDGKYVLMFKMPSGEWALSDVTGGIPYGGNTIDVATYLKQMPSYQPSWSEVFIYSLAPNFMQQAAQYAADAGALATSVATVTGSTIAAAFAPIAANVVAPLTPILIAALVVLAVIYVPKPR